MNFDAPTVTPTGITPNRTYPGAHVVTIQCPYCHQKHSHGLPVGETTAGHRIPHCVDPEARGRASMGGGYLIAAANIGNPPRR